jgi:hypothetical protein
MCMYGYLEWYLQVKQTIGDLGPVEVRVPRHFDMGKVRYLRLLFHLHAFDELVGLGYIFHVICPCFRALLYVALTAIISRAFVTVTF